MAALNGNGSALGSSTTNPTKEAGGSEPTRLRFTLPAIDPAERDRRRAERAELESRRQQFERDAAWARLCTRMGRRYADCRLDNFDLTDNRLHRPKQREVVGRLQAIIDNIDAEIDTGRNVALFGPVGTGKDHLLAALVRSACQAGRSVEWVNGVDLFGDVRDAIDSEKAEAHLLSQWTAPDVLAISDPLPPWGPLTSFQAQVLFRIVDRRYRDRKPVWITANFADGKEAGERLGVQVVDRIRDGAVQLYCAWPSYRRSQD